MTDTEISISCSTEGKFMFLRGSINTNCGCCPYRNMIKCYSYPGLFISGRGNLEIRKYASRELIHTPFVNYKWLQTQKRKPQVVEAR